MERERKVGEGVKMSPEIVGTAFNTWNGKKFKYNGIIDVRGWNAPLRSTTKSNTWLHPSKVDFATLRYLNPDKSDQQVNDFFMKSQKALEQFQKEKEALI